MFDAQLSMPGEKSPFRIMAAETALELKRNAAFQTRELEDNVDRILTELRQTFDTMMELTPHFDPAIDAIRQQLVHFLSHHQPEFERVKKQLLDIELSYQRG